MPDQERRIELLDDLRAFADKIDHTPSRAEMNDDGPHSSSPYYTEFGSWNDALEAAGLEPTHRNDVSDDELLDELQRLADDLDRTPLWEDMDEHGEYSPDTYRRRWGSWLDAREAAGLEESERRPGRQICPEDLIDALRELAMMLDRVPSQTDMNCQGKFSVKIYYTEFGSWKAALEAAGVGGNRGDSMGE